MQLHGIIPPLVTPMTADEEIDLAGLRRHIDYLLGHKVHGIFVLGTTGEFFALDEHEKQEIIVAAVEHVNGRVPVYAGTGAETTREVIRLTQMAEREKVQGVSVITPYFLSPTQGEMIDHYRRIAESTALPVILYNNPATTGGVKLDPETVARLAEIPNIAGIKDSSGDLQNLIELVRLSPPTFSVLQGRDTLILSALQFGAKGAIPVSSNIVPHFCVGIYEAHKSGDFEAAKTFQLKLNPLRLGLFLGTAPGTIKIALGLVGQGVGPSRSPIGPLPADKLAKLKSVLETAGLMKG